MADFIGWGFISYRKKGAYILVWVDSCWLTWFWKQLLKKHFLTSRFFFFVYLLPSLANNSSNIKLLSSREGASEQNLVYLKSSLWIYWFRLEFFLEKNNSLFLSIFDVIFVYVRHNLNTYRAQPLPLDEKNEPYHFFHFLPNGFHDFENDCFRKVHKYYLILPFFSFLSIFHWGVFYLFLIW